MCGILGTLSAAATIYKDPKSGSERPIPLRFVYAEEFLRDGFVCSTLRGNDSAGVFVITPETTSRWHKAAVPGHAFVKDPTTIGLLKKADTALGTIGHVRHATSGSKDAEEQAHPFMVRKVPGDKNSAVIVGVHNGSLIGWGSAKDAGNYKVDSEWAFAQIAQKGISALDDIRGAFSFVWWDSEDPHALYFARNNARPMCFAMTEDGKKMLYASEAGMLQWLADRNNIKLGSEIYETPAGMAFRVDAATTGTLDFEEVAKFKAEAEVATYTNWTPTYGGNYSGYLGSRSYDYYYDLDWGSPETFIRDLKRILEDGAAESAGVDAMEDTNLVMTQRHEDLPSDEDFEEVPEVPAGTPKNPNNVLQLTLSAAPYVWFDVSRGADESEQRRAKASKVFGKLVTTTIAEVGATTAAGTAYKTPEHMVGSYAIVVNLDENPEEVKEGESIPSVIIGEGKDYFIVTPIKKHYAAKARGRLLRLSQLPHVSS